MQASPTAAPDFRERHHRAIWLLLWPVRAWFMHFPVHRGKGLLYRHVILPALPPKPASFAYHLRSGETLHLFYREDLGTKVLFDGPYEDREIAALCEQVVPGSTVFDVGANIGLSALEFARATGSSGKVIAFEPHPDTATRLAVNLRENGVDNVEIVQSAVGAAPGSVTFHESAQPTLSSASVIPPDFVRSFEVPVTTVDLAWAQAGCPQVSAFKIDVEGGELAVLHGAAELLAQQSPAILLEAWGPAQLEPIDALLVAAGYARYQPEGFEPRNYLFLKS
ncbi:MAG TPA: FkbM family methyltransferase [Novosphingobium sp.]|nr:FkbM family methyltransferase [Novosphingobium sp.]